MGDRFCSTRICQSKIDSTGEDRGWVPTTSQTAAAEVRTKKKRNKKKASRSQGGFCAHSVTYNTYCVSRNVFCDRSTRDTTFSRQVPLDALQMDSFRHRPVMHVWKGAISFPPKVTVMLNRLAPSLLLSLNLIQNRPGLPQPHLVGLHTPTAV